MRRWKSDARKSATGTWKELGWRIWNGPPRIISVAKRAGLEIPHIHCFVILSPHSRDRATPREVFIHFTMNSHIFSSSSPTIQVSSVLPITMDVIPKELQLPLVVVVSLCYQPP